MQSRTVISASLVLSILACTSEPTSLDPSAGPSLARAAARTYTAVLLGTPGSTNSWAHDINPAGQVVGSFEEQEGGEWDWALWNKGVMTNLGSFAGDFSEAMAINPQGQVVGYTVTELAGVEVKEAFLWDNGVITDLGRGTASDINPAGQVVGYTEFPFLSAAFLWEKGVRTELWPGQATGINPAGQIVGWAQGRSAVLWDKGVITELGTLGGSFSQAEDINPAGQVVGWSFVAGDVAIHAFLWDKGVMTDLGTLGGENSFARGINPSGQIVGQSATATSGFRAFVWADGVMSELPPPEGDYADAQAINPAGEIVGATGGDPGLYTSHRATLWTQKTAK